MSKQRFIWPSIWVSENFLELNFRQRLLFIGMFSLADDEGRIKASPISIKAAVFPVDNVSLEEIKSDLQVLYKTGCILLYKVNSEIFASIVKWDIYQHPKYKVASKIPPPGNETDLLSIIPSTGEVLLPIIPSTGEVRSYENNSNSNVNSNSNRVENNSNSNRGDFSDDFTTAITITEKSKEEIKEKSAVEEIANYYFTLTGRTANSPDYVAITEVINSPDTSEPLSSRITMIKSTMAAMAERKARDPATGKINSFKYFKDAILSEFRKKKEGITDGAYGAGTKKPKFTGYECKDLIILPEDEGDEGQRN